MKIFVNLFQASITRTGYELMSCFYDFYVDVICRCDKTVCETIGIFSGNFKQLKSDSEIRGLGK